MPKILIIDNYDSFTYNLRDYLAMAGAEVEVIQNNNSKLDVLNIDEYCGYVFSPGPKTPNENGALMLFLEKVIQSKPVLGVCLGHQAIGQYFGMSLKKAPKPMHGKVSSIRFTSSKLFNSLPNPFDVCRYHSLVLEQDENKVTEMLVTAWSEDGCVMAIEHKILPVFGVQFHPEAILTTYGMQIVHNWLKVVNLH
jgi:anthranilate synthase/aminodeoxychorismate synthase-like glutamine amidotransferase